MSSTPRNAVPVNWSSEGAGRALVLLHGLGGDLGFWAGETPGWSKDFRVIALDLRGSGGTAVTEDGHSMATLADDVCAVLDEAGVESAHVVGFSMGGLVAQALARAVRSGWTGWSSPRRMR